MTRPGITDREFPTSLVLLAGVSWAISAAAPGIGALAAAVLVVVSISLLALIQPASSIALLAMSIPFQAVGSANAGGVNLTLTKLCLLGLLIGWLPRAIAGRSPLDVVFIGYGLVLVSLVISVVAVTDFGAWAAAVYQWLVAMVVYLIARTEIRSVTHQRSILAAMAVGVIGVGLYSIAQVAAGDGPPSFVVHGLMRAYGTFGWPNPLAAYLEMTLPMLAAVLVLPIIWRGTIGAPDPFKILIAGALAVGGVAFMLTQSFGGMLGMGMALLVLVAISNVAIQLVTLIMLCIGLAVLVATPSGVSYLQSYWDALARPTDGTSANWADAERRAHWSAALAMWKDHPWFGAGAGEFNNHFREYTTQWRFRISRGHAHNGYLQLTAEAGVIGFVTFATWCVSMLTILTRGASRNVPFESRTYAIGAMACVAAFLVHSLVDHLTVLSFGIQLAIIIAMGLARPDSVAPGATKV